MKSFKNVADAISEMHQFNKDNKGISFTLCMENDAGEFEVHERVNQPCYGELRPYSEDEYRPNDLHDPFPDGRPVAVGINLQYCPAGSRWFTRGGTSPWAPLFKDRIEFSHNRKEESSFVLTDTFFNPTWLVQGLVTFRSVSQYLSGPNVDPITDIMMMHSLIVNPYKKEGKYSVGKQRGTFLSYCLPHTLSVGSFIRGRPFVDHSLHLYDRTPYVREGMERIWVNPEAQHNNALWDQPEIQAMIGRDITLKDIPTIQATIERLYASE